MFYKEIPFLTLMELPVVSTTLPHLGSGDVVLLHLSQPQAAVLVFP